MVVNNIKRKDCRLLHSGIYISLFQRKSKDANYSVLIWLPRYIIGHFYTLHCTLSILFRLGRFYTPLSHLFYIDLVTCILFPISSILNRLGHFYISHLINYLIKKFVLILTCIASSFSLCSFSIINLHFFNNLS